MKTNKDNLLYNDQDHLIRFIVRCIINVLCVIVGVFLGLKFLTPFWANIINDSTIFDVNKMTNQDLQILKSMVEHNKIFTADFTVTKLIEFYEIIIQFLIGLFAIFGVLGFIYIKFSYRRDINDAMQDFINSKAGQLILKDMFQEYLKTMEIKPIVEEVFNKEKNSGDISNILEDNEILHEQIDNIQKEQEQLREGFDDLIENINKNISFEEEIKEQNEDSEN